MTADTLLATKLRLPTPRPNLVSRPHLVERLAEGLRLGRRLTLVSAPPGFGKTTLIREWAGSLEPRVAWLTLDRDDSDATRFLRYVLAALNQADGCIGRAPEPWPPSASPQEVLSAAINDLAGMDAGLTLILDDYQSIDDYAVHELLAFLLEKQPPHFHVVIGTREDPPLPLARLRARDQLTEIRERALRFSQAEAGAFLNRTMGLGLSARSVAVLAARTEGWVTGLQLAGLALRQESAADEFVAAFAGDDRYIVDYLVAEVLEREPEPVQSFLRQTCILDHLCAPLCDALTGRDDAQTMLEQLESANLFLVPLDNRREWYRYHVLFADVLRLALSEEERNELQRKATLWFEAHGASEPAPHGARSAARPVKQPLVEPLSERELEVLQLIAQGYANAEIAARLFIALGTAKRHINNIYGKLGVSSRTQAVARARALGLLP